jgi:glutamate racemase
VRTRVSSSRSIGVFDSGIGGLTVVRALMERLPFENIVYFGDTARVPYGVKSPETITQYAIQITHFLLQKDVKLLIVACNTMAAIACEAIKKLSPVPILEVIDAGATRAIEETKSKRVAVIGTPATINSNAYALVIHEHDPDIRVFSKACPLFVPLVEEGWWSHPVTRLTALEYLRPVLVEHIDTLILGCTHYPVIKPLIREITGPEVRIVDSAEAIANMSADLLNDMNLRNPQRRSPLYRFYVSDVPFHFHMIAEGLLGRTISGVERVKW